MSEKPYDEIAPHKNRARFTCSYRLAPAEVIESTIKKHLGALRDGDRQHSLFNESDITGEQLAAWCPPTWGWGHWSHNDDRAYWLWPEGFRLGFDGIYAKDRDRRMLRSAGEFEHMSNEFTGNLYRTTFLTQVGQQVVGRLFEYRFEPGASGQQSHTSIAIYQMDELNTFFGKPIPEMPIEVVALVPKGENPQAQTLERVLQRIKERDAMVASSPWAGL